MNCPKCKALLIIVEKHLKSGNVYKCFGCSLSGTYRDMEIKAEQIRQRLKLQEPKFKCSICQIPKPFSETKYAFIEDRSCYVCTSCIPGDNKVYIRG